MKLPNPHKAAVPPDKVRDYLLSPLHSVGRHKAAFFGALGYTQNDWRTLEADLRRLAAQDVEGGEQTQYGVKYEIRGTIMGPSGRSAAIVTAWIVRDGEDFARFITAYPEG